MNRRELLLGAMATAAVVSTPTLSFANRPTVRHSAWSVAWRHAAQAGRALLVLVVPEDSDDAERRAHALGAWLQGASRRQLAPLADLELCCATLSALERRLPDVSESGDAWLVLVRVDQPTPTWRTIVPDVPRETMEREGTWRKPYPAEGKVVRGLERSVERVLHSEGLTRDDAEGARLAHERWVVGAPGGSEWQADMGCSGRAPRLPVRNSAAIACGMGHSVARAERFLSFWGHA